jgi:cytoskeletal protein RodZ
MTRRVSLAELAASDIELRPSEAVSLVVEVCRRRHNGLLRGVPSPSVIRLTPDGELTIEGPVTTGDDVPLAAQLLDGLLAPFDTVPEYRASGALRLVIARALGTLDLPPYASLDEFCVALQRFTTVDATETARMLFLAWDRARATRELRTAPTAALTISDVRRARRASGLSLEDIAAVAEVPARKLRDLEWGYMRDWSADVNGRAQLVRYARAAGLDERLVVSIAWPLIEESAIGGTIVGADTMELVPSAPQQLVRTRPQPVPRKLARAGWTAAAAAALLVAVFPAVAVPWSSTPSRTLRVEMPDAVEIGSTADNSSPVVIVPPAPRVPAREPALTPVRAATRTPARASTRAPARASTRPPEPEKRSPAATPKRRPAREGSILNRELIRIVFR